MSYAHENETMCGCIDIVVKDELNSTVNQINGINITNEKRV